MTALIAISGRSALAHDPSLSGIRVLYRSADTIVTVNTHISRLSQAEHLSSTDFGASAADAAVRRRLKLVVDGKPLTINGQPNIIFDRTNDLLTWQEVLPFRARLCDATARLYPEDAGSRTLFTETDGGVTVRETLIDSHTDPVASRAAAAPKVSVWRTAWQFVRQGVEHILSGPDHIAFVIGLLLFGGSLMALLKTVTAFTVAHSITLTLAALGKVHPSSSVVEPLIALSIVVIAAENLRAAKPPVVAGDDTPRRDYRPLLAFGFGLIHGFGFAGALAEVGLPARQLAAALASFNLGVEIGQAGIVLMIYPVVAALAKNQPTRHRILVRVGSCAIGAAGLFWFVTRLLPAG